MTINHGEHLGYTPLLGYATRARFRYERTWTDGYEPRIPATEQGILERREAIRRANAYRTERNRLHKDNPACS